MPVTGWCVELIAFRYRSLELLTTLLTNCSFEQLSAQTLHVLIFDGHISRLAALAGPYRGGLPPVGLD